MLHHPYSLLNMLQGVEATLAAKGTLDAINFTAQGPAGIFALYVAPTANLGQVFVNEFVCVRVDPSPFLHLHCAFPKLRNRS